MTLPVQQLPVQQFMVRPQVVADGKEAKNTVRPMDTPETGAIHIDLKDMTPSKTIERRVKTMSPIKNSLENEQRSVDLNITIRVETPGRTDTNLEAKNTPKGIASPLVHLLADSTANLMPKHQSLEEQFEILTKKRHRLKKRTKIVSRKSILKLSPYHHVDLHFTDGFSP